MAMVGGAVFPKCVIVLAFHGAYHLIAINRIDANRITIAVSVIRQNY